MVESFCTHSKGSFTLEPGGTLHCFPEPILGKALPFSYEALVLDMSDSCQQHIPTQAFKDSQLPSFSPKHVFA